MTRYKGRISTKAIEQAYPHIVEMIVPLGGFGKKLDEMYEWHRARGIQDQTRTWSDVVPPVVRTSTCVIAF